MGKCRREKESGKVGFREVIQPVCTRVSDVNGFSRGRRLRKIKKNEEKQFNEEGDRAAFGRVTPSALCHNKVL